jgi:hypothetical protein
MRFREKVLILSLAICVSVLGFNLIASSSLDLLKTARAAGYESIQSYLAKCDDNLNHGDHITEQASQNTQSSPCLQLAKAKVSLQEKRSGRSSRITEDQ